MKDYDIQLVETAKVTAKDLVYMKDFSDIVYSCGDEYGAQVFIRLPSDQYVAIYITPEWIDKPSITVQLLKGGDSDENRKKQQRAHKTAEKTS